MIIPSTLIILYLEANEFYDSLYRNATCIEKCSMKADLNKELLVK